MKRETGLLNLISTYITSWLDKPLKTSGLAILLALFFASCEEPLEAPSSKLVPNDNNTNLKYIEIPLEASQAAFDTSIVSSNNVNGSDGIIYFGYFSDGQIGDATLRAYAGLTLETGFDPGTVSNLGLVSSARLILRFKNFYGEDYDNEQIINVRSLSQDIIDNKYYKTSDSISTEKNVSRDSSTIINPTVFLNNERTDSLVVKLSEIYGDELLDIIKNNNDNISEINRLLKGIEISLTDQVNAINGIDISSGRSYIELVYQDPGQNRDTLQLNFNVTSFTNLKFDPGTLIPSSYSARRSFQLTDQNAVYANDMLGIYPRIKINRYLEFIDTLDYVIINNAELIIDNIDPGEKSSRIHTSPLNFIFPYYIEESSILKQGEDFWGIQSNFTSSGAFGNQESASSLTRLAYQSGDMQISGDISLFLQEIFDNSTFWEEERSILLNGQFINRNLEPFDPSATFLIGNYNNFLINSDDIKLRIYYTTFEN